jgi:ACS family hexuronate transporter-like MFS transporter
LTAFSVTYAAAAPFAGLLIDRIGLNRGITLAIGLWSLAGIATGLVRGLSGFVFFRALLGLAESAGIPAAGKAIHTYLPPKERAFGNSCNQAGVSLGMVLAPPVATWLALRYNWRIAFIVTGILGLIWIPVWNQISRISGPPRSMPKEPALRAADVLRDKRIWAFMLANALSMMLYSLWTNWTTLYLVGVNHLSLGEAAWFAWIPPIFFTLGGFAGGWFSLRAMARGLDAVSARLHVCLIGAVLATASAAVPWLPNAAWVSAGISLSVFGVAAFSVNMYTIPLDVFGGSRAAFAISMLVAAYGAMQAVVSPLIGKIIDQYGYLPVCVTASLTPLSAYGILKCTR